MTAPAATPIPADEDGFRSELRAFLERCPPGPSPSTPAARLVWRRDWARLLVDEGWAGPSWPAEWGGLDLPVRLQVAYHQEMAAARAPRHPSPTAFTVGPTIIAHGTDEQRRRFLRPMLAGDELWAQGYSEPSAGSDLASLRTTAVLDGDHYVVSGHKVWSTQADVADWMFLLARTGGPGSGRAGISFLLAEMSAPGVSVRPLRDLTGRRDFCEVVLDEVRVPVAHRVGPHDGGWAIARTSLGHERSVASAARAAAYGPAVERVWALARQTGRATDPLVRDRLARAYVGARLLALTSGRVLGRVEATGDPGPAASVARLGFARFEQALHELAVDVCGPAGALAAADRHSPAQGRWAQGFLRTRASTIGAGTAEIQRNTVAEQVLGLPREPEVA